VVCVVEILASWQLGVWRKRAMDGVRDKRNLAALAALVAVGIVER
jgi:hypothetical protein